MYCIYICIFDPINLYTFTLNIKSNQIFFIHWNDRKKNLLAWKNILQL